MSSASEADAALRALVDRQQIEALIHQYCRCVDRIDPALGHAVFHADATADYGEFYCGTAHDAVDAICESHRHCVMHSHQVTTTIITLDGDRAGSEAYHFATVRMMARDTLMQVSVWGRYLDRWSRREGRWAIDHRVGLRDLDEIRPASPLTPPSPREEMSNVHRTRCSALQTRGYLDRRNDHRRQC